MFMSPCSLWYEVSMRTRSPDDKAYLYWEGAKWRTGWERRKKRRNKMNKEEMMETHEETWWSWNEALRRNEKNGDICDSRQAFEWAEERNALQVKRNNGEIHGAKDVITQGNKCGRGVMWRICIKRVTGQYSRDRQREYWRRGGAPLADISLEIL